MRRVRSIVVALVAVGALVGVTSCGDDADPADTASGATATATKGVEALTVKVLDRHDHDTTAFTEGLTFDDGGRMFESLGLDGSSSIREVDPSTGEVQGESALAANQFGEGIALGPKGIVQLTWKNGVANIWDPASLEALGTVPFAGEGWGLTFDGKEFIQSDGSDKLTRRDATTFEPTGTIDVRRDGEPVDELNELEWVDGVIYANVWHSDEILRIDPASGRVTGVIDASKLWTDPARTTEMTLNGIAHEADDPAGHLWLTGKNWPTMFEVEVVAA